MTSSDTNITGAVIYTMKQCGEHHATVLRTRCNRLQYWCSCGVGYGNSIQSQRCGVLTSMALLASARQSVAALPLAGRGASANALIFCLARSTCAHVDTTHELDADASAGHISTTDAPLCSLSTTAVRAAR